MKVNGRGGERLSVLYFSRSRSGTQGQLLGSRDPFSPFFFGASNFERSKDSLPFQKVSRVLEFRKSEVSEKTKMGDGFARIFSGGCEATRQFLEGRGTAS